MLDLQGQIVDIFFREFGILRVLVWQVVEVIIIVDDLILHDLLVKAIAFFCHFLDLSLAEGELLRLLRIDIVELIDD